MREGIRQYTGKVHTWDRYLCLHLELVRKFREKLTLYSGPYVLLRFFIWRHFLLRVKYYAHGNLFYASPSLCWLVVFFQLCKSLL